MFKLAAKVLVSFILKSLISIQINGFSKPIAVKIICLAFTGFGLPPVVSVSIRHIVFVEVFDIASIPYLIGMYILNE